MRKVIKQALHEMTLREQINPKIRQTAMGLAHKRFNAKSNPIDVLEFIQEAFSLNREEAKLLTYEFFEQFSTTHTFLRMCFQDGDGYTANYYDIVETDKVVKCQHAEKESEYKLKCLIPVLQAEGIPSKNIPLFHFTLKDLVYAEQVDIKEYLSIYGINKWGDRQHRSETGE